MATKVKLSKLLKIRLMRFKKDEKIIRKNLNIWSVVEGFDLCLRFEVATSIYNKGIVRIPFFSMKTQEFLSFLGFFLDYVRYDKILTQMAFILLLMVELSLFTMKFYFLLFSKEGFLEILKYF